MSIEILIASPTDLNRLDDLVHGMGNTKDEGYFEKCFTAQDKQERMIFIVQFNGEDAGYGVFNRRPKYALFKKLNIPAIQDLNVLPAYRRNGIGRAMVEWCEHRARAEGYTDIGLGVGLHAGYGAAQRLYVKAGYIPDGTGVNYDRRPLKTGEFRPLDDYLCLMMVKALAH